MSRILRSAIVAQSGVALPMRIRPPNCRPAWSRLARPSSLAALMVRGGLPRMHSSPGSMKRCFRRRSCWSPSSYQRRQPIRRIFFMNSPAGMAITRLSVWQRRRSSKDGQFADLRLGFFAVGDRPLLAKAASKLIDVAVTTAVLSEASSLLGEELDPPEDQQATPAMRRHLAKVLLARGVSSLLSRPDLGVGAPA